MRNSTSSLQYVYAHRQPSESAIQSSGNGLFLVSGAKHTVMIPTKKITHMVIAE